MPRQQSACRALVPDVSPPIGCAPPAPRPPRGTARKLLAALSELATTKQALREAEERCAEREAELALRAAAAPPCRELSSLAAASHDLRDPLQVIASYVELLADGLYGPVTADQRASLMRVRGHVDYLSAVVGSVLVLARASRDGPGLQTSSVPVPDLFADVRLLVESFAVARGVSLVVDCSRAPVAVRAEPTAIRRVLTNLTANAVKFTPRGGRVWLWATTSANGVELHVADTGPGIPPTQIDAIFEPFVQVHASDECEPRGAGLGLAIARDLTRRMGGELLVRSTTGVGSLFTARFPSA